MNGRTVLVVVKSLELFRSAAPTNLQRKRKTRKDERTLSSPVLICNTNCRVSSPEGRAKVTHLIFCHDTSVHSFNGNFLLISHNSENSSQGSVFIVNLTLDSLILSPLTSCCISCQSISLFSLKIKWNLLNFSFFVFITNPSAGMCLKPG